MCPQRHCRIKHLRYWLVPFIILCILCLFWYLVCYLFATQDQRMLVEFMTWLMLPTILGFFLKMTFHGPIIRCLTKLFPVTFGYQKQICVGTSSLTLEQILLDIDIFLPTEEQYQLLQEGYNHFLDDVKKELENKMITTTFSALFVGSIEERFGVQISRKRKIPSVFNALLSDVDIMLCCETFNASFNGQGNISINDELDTNQSDSSAYCEVNFLGHDNSHKKLIDPKVILNNVKEAIRSSKVTHLPGRVCCGCCFVPVFIDIIGPTVKVLVGYNNILSNTPNRFRTEADITLCIKCLDWPPSSDWQTRERLWPSVEDVQRISSNGFHLVAKPLTHKKESLSSWRYSFSVAEVELSKLVPDTARRCFLALKIIFKDHLKTILPKLSSYHMKTIFLNTLEKKTESFWVDENIVDCFETLLGELYSALESGCCNHYWLRDHVNLFDFENKSDKKRLSIVARKLRKIQKNPAPYINDDSCCCVCLCCVCKTDADADAHRENNQYVLIDSQDIGTDIQQDGTPLTDID